MTADDTHQASAETGIRRTLAEYCQLVDDARFGPWSELFAANAVLKGNGAVGAESRAAILDWITKAIPSRAGGKHMTLNAVIDVAGDTARVSSDFLYLAPSDDGPVVGCAGRYVDRFVLEAGRWRIAERDIVIPPGWVRASVWAGKGK